MNKSIRGVAVFIGVMFLALLVNVTAGYWIRSDELNEDARNTRVRDEQFGGPRGPILAANTPIVQSVETGTLPYAYQREYLDGPLYAPFTGYYSYIYGRSGLEARFNAELAGTADSQFMQRILDTLAGSTPSGAQLLTTIQPKLQQAAWDALGGQEGGAIAIDYQTGAVLAWVSTPSYDVAELASLDFPATQEAWEQFTADGSTVMNDRATQEINAPGSTFKLVVAAAALANGYTAGSVIDTPAALPLPESTHQLTNLAACGNTTKTLDQALTLSCNTTFANIGMALGQDIVDAQAQAFGFGSSLGDGFSSAASVFPTGMSQAELAMASIGQFDVATTPLQMAVVAGAIANGGTVMEPYIVQEIRDSNESVLSTYEPVVFNQAMTEANAATLAELMTHVVQSGTGTAAQIPGFTVGGKTGTAETTVGGGDHSWFAGYIAEKHVAVAVYLAHETTTTATPIARAMMEAASS